MLKAAPGAVIRVLVYVAKAHSYLWRKPATKNGRALPALMRKVEAIRLPDGMTRTDLAAELGANVDNAFCCNHGLVLNRLQR